MKKTLLAAGAVLALSSSFTVNAAENDKPQYLSDWWHQSVNVVGSYHTRFGPQLRNDTYLEYEAFAKKDWFDFYGYADAPVFFGGNSDAKGIWNHGSPLFMEIEPRFSIDKLTNTDLSFGPFKEWYFANNYIYDMGRNKDGRQSTWGGQLSYIGFTNFDWGSDLGDDSGYANNGIKTRTNNSIASSHILALNYDHWHYSVVARYWHNGGQWNDDAELNFGNGNFNVRSTGWGGYLVVGYNF
ncbi:MAG: nucleoside-specific channel-forming protein Tsx [Escherichia coli]|nr:nucleoside-specific channel-forming protein Tsx [Escherichia coli]